MIAPYTSLRRLPHVGPFVLRNEELVCKSCAFHADAEAEERDKWGNGLAEPLYWQGPKR